MKIGEYEWRPRNKLHLEWWREPEGYPDTAKRYWVVSLHVNDEPWRDLFKDFENKPFDNASPGEFAEGAPGDPALIFQRAFDGERPLHIIINLAFGGTPFPQADLSLDHALLAIHSLKVTPRL